MINFNTPRFRSKWQLVSPFIATASFVDDYNRHFNEALQNLEMNLQEERLTGGKRSKRRR